MKFHQNQTKTFRKPRHDFDTFWKPSMSRVSMELISLLLNIRCKRYWVLNSLCHWKFHKKSNIKILMKFEFQTQAKRRCITSEYLWRSDIVRPCPVHSYPVCPCPVRSCPCPIRVQSVPNACPMRAQSVSSFRPCPCPVRA
jgi:hypothetical protein